MTAYPWPRNLDQLHWVMREIALLTENAYVTAETVKVVLAKEEKLEHANVPAAGKLPLSPDQTLEEMTYEIVCTVLAEEHGNKERTAARLGIGRTTLWRILKNHE